ncbi:MAG: type II toxin-antitoxin system Phd/YefM family antitoxin [Candidatus Omnitrophica bacterium]|nr:type II toxin-antitoxin system Phd/YefM family antitoxin [Candidatus Omnitrophota bacterium]
MITSIVNLRYKMKEVLKALDRREKVNILYHGKLKGIIVPAKKEAGGEVKKHPFFGMNRQDKKSVEQQIDELRGYRYDDI